MALRDITPDLQERLAAIADERKVLEHRLEELQKMEDSLQALLDHETARWRSLSQSSHPLSANAIDQGRRAGQKSPLSALLLNELSDGKPRSTATLSEAAIGRGYVFGKKHPRKSVHFALVALSNAGKVRKEKGVWKIMAKDRGDAG